MIADLTKTGSINPIILTGEGITVPPVRQRGQPRINARLKQFIDIGACAEEDLLKEYESLIIRGIAP